MNKRDGQEANLLGIRGMEKWDFLLSDNANELTFIWRFLIHHICNKIDEKIFF